MGYTVRTGFKENGIPTGNRRLRGPDTLMKNNAFKNPMNLCIDIIKFILTALYISVRNIIRMFTAKPKSLRGKVCFVTGSGRGLGRGICIALAREGAILACADINEEGNSKTVEILQEMGAKAKAYKLNVANKQEVDAIVARVESDLGEVYLLVNNAAIVMPSPVLDEEYVRAAFGVNTLGNIWTIGAFLPKMKEKNEGHIVTISSLASALGVSFLSTYSATKSAISSYSETLRLELYLTGYDNIYVTTVHPGTTNTSADYMEGMKWRLPVHRPDDVAAFVVNSVKYNKGTVSTDPIPFFIGHMLKFLPREVAASVLRIVDIEATLPSVKEYKDIEAADLVRRSNCISEEKSEAGHKGH